MSIDQKMKKYEEKIKNQEGLTEKELKEYRNYLGTDYKQKLQNYTLKIILLIIAAFLLIAFMSLAQNYTLYLGLFYLFSILAILIYIWSKKGKLTGRKKFLYYFYPFYFAYALGLKIFLKLGLNLSSIYIIIVGVICHTVLRKKIEEDS